MGMTAKMKNAIYILMVAIHITLSGDCTNCEATYELYDKKCYIEINGCE